MRDRDVSESVERNHGSVDVAKAPKIRLLVGLLLAAIGAVLTAFAWSTSSPMGASPDEPAHINYAWGAATGQVYPWTLEEGTNSREKTIAYIDIPAQLTQYPSPTCYVNADYSAVCQVPLDSDLEGQREASSYMAKYPLAYYMPIGMVLRLGLGLGLSGFSTLLLGRIVSALASYLLIGVAGWTLTKRYGWRASVLPLALALVPNTHFQFASINPNGLEISLAILLAAIIVAIRFDVASHVSVSRSLQWALILTTLALGWTRPLGIAWIGLLLILLLVPVRGRHIIREIPKLTSVMVVLVCGIVFCWFLYQATGTMTQSSVGELDEWEEHPFLLKAAVILFRFGPMLEMGFGTLGWADTPLPQIVFLAWLVYGAFALGSCLKHTNKSDQAVRLPWIGALFAGSVLIIFVESLHAGFGWQGRYWLPILSALLVLLVPSLSDGMSGRSGRVSFVWGAVGLMGGISLFSVIYNMWRYQFGFDSVFVRFAEIPYPWRDPVWIPAGGNLIFYATAILGLVAIVSSIWLCRGFEPQELKSQQVQVAN